MTKIIISGSILSADFTRLGDQLKEAEDAGMDWVHIDVIDGHFAPNITMGPFIVEHCKKVTNLPLDVHLMIEKPENHINAFANAGTDRLSIHIENNSNVYRTLQEVRRLGVSPTIVLNPGTPATAIQSVLDLIDMVLVMTVSPGFSGQAFIPYQVKKINSVKEMLINEGLNTLIQVDGGITPETLPSTFSAGANVFVAATAIFKAQNGIAAGISALRKSIAG